MLADTIEVAKWCESEGADAIHVSTGSLFPHPLNPPGDFSFETIATTYDAMISSGVDAFRNFLLFRYRVLRPIFRWIWFRMKKGLPIEGVSLEEARAIKASVSIPVLNTGGYQTASFVRNGIASGAFDGVAIARSLVANNDLVRAMAVGPGSAGAALHLLQQVPAQRAEESDGLLRARSLSQPRGHDRRVDDDLRHARDAEPAAGSSLGRSMPWPPNHPSPTSKRSSSDGDACSCPL